ncbi:MAG: hypothetical protein GF370_02425 [Candidatus Nealsonbacteria bacterium]|nr:hypothetical protein [Candidatus Nealsonbacteria bacterium]
MPLQMIIIVLVDLVAGLAPVLVFLRLQESIKKRKQRKDQFRYLSCFVGLYGVLRLLAALRGAFVFVGRQQDLGMLVWNWGTGPLTYLHLVPLTVFYGMSFFPRKKSWRNLYIEFILLFVAITVVTHFAYPSTPGEITSWGTRPEPHPITEKLFTFTIFFPLTLSCIVDLFRRIRRWMKNKALVDRQLVWVNSGILIYAFSGFFDALALAKGWAFLAARIGIMISALVIYVGATWELE